MELVAILAWPLVALCALGAVVWVAYDWRRPTELAVKFEHVEQTCRDNTGHVARLAERVGQLEIAQGVKRGRA